MSNRLKMALVHSIQLLHSLRWSQRRIARELGIDRETVGKHLAGGLEQAKPAISPAGSGSSKPATFRGPPGPRIGGKECADGAGNEGVPKPAISPTGSDAALTRSKPADHPAGGARPPGSERSAADYPAWSGEGQELLRGVGRPSACEPYREIIRAKVNQELEAQRIYQDLVAEHGFAASYDSVKRFVRKLGLRQALPVMRPFPLFRRGLNPLWAVPVSPPATASVAHQGLPS